VIVTFRTSDRELTTVARAGNALRASILAAPRGSSDESATMSSAVDGIERETVRSRLELDTGDDRRVGAGVGDVQALTPGSKRMTHGFAFLAALVFSGCVSEGTVLKHPVIGEYRECANLDRARWPVGGVAGLSPDSVGDGECMGKEASKTIPPQR
jgi:hypothetical protein